MALNPLPDVIAKLHRFWWLLSAACWLSRATGSQNGSNLDATEVTTTQEIQVRK